MIWTAVAGVTLAAAGMAAGAAQQKGPGAVDDVPVDRKSVV